MYVTIAGCGDVGYRLAQSLREEGYNVAVIESDEERFKRAESLDVLAIMGNAADISKLEDANIEKADIFIGTTGSDEINMLSCAFAKSRNTKTIAVINQREYLNEPVSHKYNSIGVDIAICPKLVTALKINKMLMKPSMISELETFSMGKVGILESIIPGNSEIANKKIQDIQLPKSCNLVAIFRDGDIVIPHGSDAILEGDKVVLIVGEEEAMPKLKNLLGTSSVITKKHNNNHKNGEGLKKVIIVGATRTGTHLAHLLEDKVNVTLIEESEEKCRLATEYLSRALVIHGNPTDKEVLTEEGVSETDTYIAVTEKEETNLLSCLLAKQYGAKKTIALVDKVELKSVLEYAGVDLPISQTIATTNSILQHTHPSYIKNVKLLGDGAAQMLEYVVPETSNLIGKQLKKLHLPTNTIIGAIGRNGSMVVPRGDEEVLKNDRLIIFTKTNVIPKLEKLF